MGHRLSNPRRIYQQQGLLHPLRINHGQRLQCLREVPCQEININASRGVENGLKEERTSLRNLERNGGRELLRCWELQQASEPFIDEGCVEVAHVQDIIK